MTKTPPQTPNEDSGSLRLLRASARITQAAQARQFEEQELGFSAREFVFCGLPYKKPKSLIHERRDGRYTLKVKGDAEYGLPYGHDRLVLLWLASAFQAAGCPQDNTIRFSFACDILRPFYSKTYAPSGIEMRRLRQRIERVFGANYYLHDRFLGEDTLLALGFRLISRVRLWFQRKEHPNQYALFKNSIQLSAEFANELRRASIPIDLDSIRGLKKNVPALDLYLWQAWRSFRLEKDGEREVVLPVFGPEGLLRQLGTEVDEPRKARQLLRRWQALVKRAWPECENSLSSDGDSFLVRPGLAVRPNARLSLDGVAQHPEILPALPEEHPELLLESDPKDPLQNPER